MTFNPLWLLDRLRHRREQTRSDGALIDAFPVLDQISSEVPHSRTFLRAVYDDYVASVSSPDMAMSLELASFLFSFCRITGPSRILDLGSGFSSFVFRTYATQQDGKVSVTSVDDSPLWLDRTREFLTDQRLSTERLMEWASFRSADHERFDLIFHDLGSLETRAEALPVILEMATESGLVVLDDLHRRRYERAVRRVAKQRNLLVFSLRSHTLDRFGRFSSLAFASPEGA